MFYYFNYNVLYIFSFKIPRYFYKTEKVVHSMHTLGDLHEVTFFTENDYIKYYFR